MTNGIEGSTVNLAELEFKTEQKGSNRMRYCIWDNGEEYSHHAVWFFDCEGWTINEIKTTLAKTRYSGGGPGKIVATADVIDWRDPKSVMPFGDFVSWAIPDESIIASDLSDNAFERVISAIERYAGNYRGAREGEPLSQEERDEARKHADHLRKLRVSVTSSRIVDG